MDLSDRSAHVQSRSEAQTALTVTLVLKLIIHTNIHRAFDLKVKFPEEERPPPPPRRHGATQAYQVPGLQCIMPSILAPRPDL